MISFNIIRKVGKILRGGAGQREIYLGALFGVLIGMLPGANLMLGVLILAALLFNANLGVTLLGIVIGKILCLSLAITTFHIGFTIIHDIGLQGLFTSLSNMPGLALMGLDNYSQVGGALIALIIAVVFAKVMSINVLIVRKQMEKAAKNEKVGKATGNKFSRFLFWVVFGKNKAPSEEASPLFRPKGIVLIAVFLVIGLLMEFLFLDMALQKSIVGSISQSTGAEVNMDKAHLSIFGGELNIKNLQITDPDKPTHNLIQIGQLTSDINVGDLMRKTISIDLLAGSVLQTDILRDKPGKILVKEAKKPDDKKVKDEKQESGKTLDDYLAQAEKYKEWLKKGAEYLEKQKKVREVVTGGPPPKPSRAEQIERARRIGYLKTNAELLSNRPKWLIRAIEIDKVTLSSDFPMQKINASEVCSSPVLNGQPTTLTMSPQDSSEPTVNIVLRFEEVNAMHEFAGNLKGIDLSKTIKTGDKLTLEKAMADLSANGSFSTDALDIPFSLTVRELITNNDALNNLKNIEVPGKLYGSLTSPRLKVEVDDNLKNAAIDAAKQKAKEEAEKQMNKALESDKAKELKDKASEGLKKFF